MHPSDQSELPVLVHPDRTMILSNSTLMILKSCPLGHHHSLHRNLGVRHILQGGVALCLLLLVDHP